MYSLDMGSTPKVITYTRVSTTEQADSGLGLSAQSHSIGAALTARGWTSARSLTDEGVSGSIAPEKRPQLAEALRMLAAGEATTLVVAKLDRATRSVADLCHLLDLSDRQGWDFIALDLGIDTSTPLGRAMAQMAGVFSELERKMIGQRTSDALAALKANGRRLGRPVELHEAVRIRIASERAQGESLRAIAGSLTEDGIQTARGGAWHASTVRAVLQSLDLDAEVAA
jgi:DNA invertase Pin-like site-specific DNA recombinase